MKKNQMSYICYFMLILYIKSIQSVENCSLTPKDINFMWKPQSNNFETYQVIELDSATTGAKCLDGTNYKFYYTPGSGSGIKKFMFFWVGGAFCGIDGYDTLESCYIRSKTEVGSSKTWGDNNTLIMINNDLGYFSSNQSVNPLFFNWNKIMINYCDGSNHQGYSEEPYQFKGNNIWFRGYNNTFSTFEYIRINYGLFDASEIIVSGASAGGQVTYIWSSYLQDYFPEKIKFMAIADAGLFLDVYNNISHCNLYRYLNQKIANLTNSNQLDLFRKCEYQSEIWKCLLPEYILSSIDIPMFIINSQIDIQAMLTQFGMPCVNTPNNCTINEKAQIEAFRITFLNHINSLINSKKNWGFWLRTCFNHVFLDTEAWYSETYNVYSAQMDNWYSLRYAMSYWYNNGDLRETDQSTFMDTLDWERNPYCQKQKNVDEIENIEETVDLEDSLDNFFYILMYFGFGLLIYGFFVSKIMELCSIPKPEGLLKELL